MKFKIKLFARNIINQEIITDFINKVSKGQSDKIKTWCKSILKNYLKNDYNNLKNITKSKDSDPEWLKEAVKRKDAQEIIIDDNFERLLVEHIFHYFDTIKGNFNHSFDIAEKQTKEWENKKNSFTIKLIKGVKIILKCEGGYNWFEVTDEETLYNEGEVLQNCMRMEEKGEEYWDEIKNKSIKILTLRDNKGVGHVGVDYNIKLNKIEQMLGKQNDNPIEIYHQYCIELIKYLKCDVVTNITKFLNIILRNSEVYDIFNLPDNLIINGDLDLSNTKIIKLPKNLVIKGDFSLINTEIIKLPDNLKVSKSLYLYNTIIKQLPNNLKIGNLYINGTKITNLPDDLEVGEYIYISKDMRLKYIPKHLFDKIKNL